MGKASSAKKVARLAEKGRGKKIRMRGGSAFPIAIGIVVVLGVLVVAVSRHYSQADAAGPTVGSHWHVAYGIYVCDKYIDPFQDNKESNPAYQELQIHSHGDGVMHWHPANEAAINRSTGKKARFKVFLDLYGVELTDSKLTISGAELTPPGDDVAYEEGKDTCDVNGKPEKGSLRTIVWDRYDKPNDRVGRISDLGEERIMRDQQVFVVAFVADSVANADIPLPPWATDLPALGAVDGGPVPSTVPGDSVPADSTPADSTPAGASGPTTSAAPATTAASATTAAAPTTAAN